VLSDPKKRPMYDQYGFYSENGFTGAGPAQGGPQGHGSQPNMDFSGFDFSDAFPGAGGAGGRRTAESGGFRDIFSQFFGAKGGAPQPQPEKGSDLEYVLTIDFWQAIKGTQARVNIARYEVCETCHGSGASGAGEVTCPQCKGTGQVTQMAGAMRFNLTCPRAAAPESCTTRAPHAAAMAACRTQRQSKCAFPRRAQRVAPARTRQRQCRRHGRAAGDLYITTKVEEHPFFHREGDDIRIQAPIAVWEAALGAKIEVPTIDGRSLLKIPQGAKNGQKFRLREKGVPNSRTGQRGDQIVEVAIQAPEPRDERTKELLREMAKLHPEDPRSEMWSKV